MKNFNNPNSAVLTIDVSMYRYIEMSNVDSVDTSDYQEKHRCFSDVLTKNIFTGGRKKSCDDDGQSPVFISPPRLKRWGNID